MSLMLRKYFYQEEMIMKVKRIVAGILAAGVVAISGSLPATNVLGLSVVSEAASKLNAPKITTKSSTTNTITLKWNAVSGASGYRLYKYDASAKKYTLFKTLSKTNCKITGVVSGVTYKFRLAAYVEKNGKKTNQTFTDVIKVTAKKLSAPSNIAASEDSGKINLTWNAVSGANSYRIYKYDDSSKKFEQYKDVTGTSYSFTEVEAGKTYKFKTAALVKNGSSYVAQSLSSEVCVTIAAKKAELKTADFTVYDADGNKHKLSDYAGKPIIVNIWATWCPPCRAELPHFDKFYKEYGDKIQFMIIDNEDKGSLSDVQKFIKDNGYSFPVFYDWDYSAYDAYGTGYIPITLAIDANGNLVYNQVGSLDESSLKSVINSIL